MDTRDLRVIFLQKSNSSSTLHGSLKDGSPTTWQPKISEGYLNFPKMSQFEDYDAQSYFNDANADTRPVGSIVFDNQLLRCSRGFAVFMSFTNPKG